MFKPIIPNKIQTYTKKEKQNKLITQPQINSVALCDELKPYCNAKMFLLNKGYNISFGNDNSIKRNTLNIGIKTLLSDKFFSNLLAPLQSEQNSNKFIDKFENYTIEDIKNIILSIVSTYGGDNKEKVAVNRLLVSLGVLSQKKNNKEVYNGVYETQKDAIELPRKLNAKEAISIFQSKTDSAKCVKNFLTLKPNENNELVFDNLTITLRTEQEAIDIAVLASKYQINNIPNLIKVKNAVDTETTKLPELSELKENIIASIILNKLPYEKSKNIIDLITQKSLSPEEAALCVAYNLSETQIDYSIHIKNSYAQLSFEDAVYCSSYNFNAQQIERYIELKTEKIYIEHVRSEGKQYKNPINRIIQQITKETQCSTAIRRRKGELSKNKLPNYEELKYILDEFGIPFFSESEIETIKQEKLDENSLELYARLKGILPHPKSSYFNSNIELYTKLKGILPIEYAIQIAKENYLFEKFMKLSFEKQHFPDEEIILIADAKLSTSTQIKAFNRIKEQGVPAQEAAYIAKNPDYINLYNEFTPDMIAAIAKAGLQKESEISLFIANINDNIPFDAAAMLAKTNNLSYTNIEDATAIATANLTTDKQIENYEYLKSQGFQITIAAQIAKDDFYLDLLKQNTYSETIIYLMAKTNSKDPEKFISNLKKAKLNGYVSISDAAEIAKDDFYIKMLEKEEETIANIFAYAKAELRTSEQFEAYKKLVNTGIDTETAAFIVKDKYYLDIYNNKENFNKAEVLEIAKAGLTTKKQFNDFRELISNKIPTYIAAQLAKDEFYINMYKNSEYSQTLVLLMAINEIKEPEIFAKNFYEIKEKYFLTNSDAALIAKSNLCMNLLKENRLSISKIKAIATANLDNIGSIEEFIKLTEQNIPEQMAAVLVKNPLYKSFYDTKVTPHPIEIAYEVLNPIFPSEHLLYASTTGTTKEVINATKKLLSKKTEHFERLKNLTSDEVQIGNIKKPRSNSSYNTEISLENGILTYKGPNSFNVKIKKAKVENKQFLVIMDNNSDNQYVSYNGSISKVKPTKKINLESLESYAHISDKQKMVLSKAIQNFPIDIIDEQGNCIIGTGINSDGIKIKPFYGKNNFNSDTDKIFKENLLTLRKANKLTLENLIRIMPKDAMIQVCPSIESENGQMLYSISTEWKSKDNYIWHFRVHSTDLIHYENDINNTENCDWIFRIGHQENINNKDPKTFKYYRFDDNKNRYQDDGVYSGEDSRSSHMQIKQPFKSNDLLTNFHFQNIIRQISTEVEDKQELNSFAKLIGISSSTIESLNKKPLELAELIVKKCTQDSKLYLQHKNYVDELRERIGYFPYGVLI